MLNFLQDNYNYNFGFNFRQHKTRDLQQQGEEHPISPSVPAAIIVENPTYGFEADVGYQADVEHPTFDVDLEMDTDAQVEAEAHVGIKDYRLWYQNIISMQEISEEYFWYICSLK